LGSLAVLVLLFGCSTELFHCRATAIKIQPYLRLLCRLYLFFHVSINVGMTIGLAPVIGIPLPFFSYGGSSILAFTTLPFRAFETGCRQARMLR